MTIAAERVASLRPTIDQLRKIGENWADLMYTMEKHAAAYDLLLARYAKFHVGDRVQLSTTPVINDSNAPGWLGSKHFLIAGACGTVREVDIHKGMFYCQVVFDAESWRDSRGVVHTVDEENRHSYCFAEDALRGRRMTTAAELLAQTDCADLRAANESLQRQNDILSGRCHRLNALLGIKEREADAMAAAIITLQHELARLRAGEIAAAELGILTMRIYDPAKRHARSVIRSAIRNGTLPQANTQRCAECGATWRPGASRHEYHHAHGYDHPRAVVCLCARCHVRREGRPRDDRGRFAMMEADMQGFICGPRLYEYASWFFEYHSYCGPWPLRKDGELRARAGRRFWDVIARFDALPETEQETYRVGGGCVRLA